MLVKSAGNSVPNATLAAPVKVAKSIIKSVLFSVSWLKVRASANNSLPSASVLPISTGVLFRENIISKGLIERSETEFSASGRRSLKLIGQSILIKVCAIPNAIALPPISFFISIMLFEGFRSNPPLSKVTPLPINVIFG